MFDFTINGIFNASLPTVFDAFCRTELLMRWCAPGNLSVSQFHSQFSSGGHFQMVLQSPDGFQQTAVGTYHDIKPNEYLSFSWRWEDTNDITKVEVKFAPNKNNNTSLSLCEKGFKREYDMLSQQYSWLACFEKLSLLIKESETFHPCMTQARYVEPAQHSSP